MTTFTDSVPTLVSELNLAHYLELLKRRWFLPLLFGLAFAAAMFLYTSTRPPMYTARADIAIVRSGTVINLDPRLRTISDTDPNASGLDQVTRRRSLQAIADSLALAEQAYVGLGDTVADLNNPQELQRRVQVRIDGDLIQIQMTSDSPEAAAQVVNAFANAYVARVNQVFGESPVTTAAFQTQAEQALASYRTKQTAVEEFISTSPIQNLLRRQDLLQRKLAAQLELESKLNRIQKDALALRNLIESGQGSASAGEELAKLVLQANTFNNSGDVPFRLDVALPNLQVETTRAQQLTQLDALLKLIESRRGEYGGAVSIELHRELSAVQTELEHAQAQQRELQTARDNAWNLYQLLVNKVNEMNVANNAESQMVRIANSAVPPNEPLETRQTLNTLLGGMVGVVIGAAVALFVRAK